MEVKRWYTLTALACSLSLQAVALAQKPEVRTIIETFVTDDAPKPTGEKTTDEAAEKPAPHRGRARIIGPDGTTLDASQITIQLPDGGTGLFPVLIADEVNRPDPKFVIGILLTEVPDSLRAHVTLPEGPGLMVGSLYPDGPAAKAGLMQYDLLLKCGEKDLKQRKDLQEIVDASEGKMVSLIVQRKGEQKTIEVTPIKWEDAKFELKEGSPLNFTGSGFNGLREFKFQLPEGQLPPGGFNLAAPIPMPAMISPLESAKQMEALTDSIRRLTEQVERLQGAIDKIEKKPE